MEFICNRIALLISIYFPPEVIGGASGAWSRAMTLSKIGYKVFILTSFPSFPSGRVRQALYKNKFFFVETVSPFTIIRVRTIPLSHKGFMNRLFIFSFFVISTMVNLPRVLRVTNRIDLVYARAPIVFSSIVGLFYSRIGKAFYIYEAPDLWPEELLVFGNPFSFAILKIGRLLANLSYSVPDMIITVSSLAAKHIMDEYHPSKSVYGIPIGTDIDTSKILPKDEARKVLISQGVIPRLFEYKFLILYSGLISKAQRVDILVDVAIWLKENGISDPTILIVGDGPEKDTIVKSVRAHKLENIHISDVLPRSIMPTLISAADVCLVMLSLEAVFKVAIPNKFYEYIACGKPVIGLSSGELKEIIMNNNVGVVIESSNVKDFGLSITSLMDREKLSIFEQRSKMLAEKFSLESIAKDLKGILTLELSKKVRK